MAESSGPVRYFDDAEPVVLQQPRALCAFGGWVDAGSSGTGAVRYLIESLNARKLADLDPDDFYSFTDTRPLTSVVGPGQRAMHWPRGEFFGATVPGDKPQDLLLFVAPEPNLKWRTFSSVVLQVLKRYGVSQILSLGAVFGAVHHRSEVPLMGWATHPELREALLQRQIGFSNYEGPTGIVTALLAEAQAQAIPSAAIVGFTPNYVQGVPNPRTSYALLKAVADVLACPLPLSDLQRSGRALARQVDKLLADQPELRERVERMLALMNVSEPGSIEDEETASQGINPDLPPPGSSRDLPTAEGVVQELEDFLRGLRGSAEGEAPSGGDSPPGARPPEGGEG